MDFDPRDHDTRESTLHDFKNDPLGPSDARDHQREDQAQALGRGPGDSRQSNQYAHALRDDARWPDREPSNDPGAVLTRHLDLPRGRERETVRDRGREYTLRGSESRTLAIVGAFRVVSSRDLRDQQDRPLDPRSSDLRHLREQGL